MRYYSFEIQGGRTYTSHPNGTNAPPDPAALQVEIDIMQEVPQAVAKVGSFVRVWGISLQEIGQAQDNNLKSVTIRGGMGKGLPLSNPAQAGILAQGTILQSFGNWIGTDMTLDLVLGMPKGGDAGTIAGAEKPDLLSFHWPAGQTLSGAIDATLALAYPEWTRDIKIRPELKLPNTETGYYTTLPQFAQFISGVSKDIIGQGYPGVDIVALPNKTLRVYDDTAAKSGGKSGGAKAIAFTDLIGQPTWLSPYEISVTCVMRSDIHSGDLITLPSTIVTIAPNDTFASDTPAFSRQSSIFKGAFQVKTVRHVGNFRTADGRAWTTVLNCYSSQTNLGTGAPASDTAAIQPPGVSSKVPPHNAP